jgi:signal transduction histidine kinase/ligand-binding sensor domain-containing protein
LERRFIFARNEKPSSTESFLLRRPLRLVLPALARHNQRMVRHAIETVFALVSAGRIRFAALIFLTAFSVCASDFSDEYLTDVWTTDDGLPDSSVTAIAQTPDGYLWIGTYNGLVRFDGMRFVTFDPATTPALAHARVRKLSVDNQGTLWINTFDGSMTSLKQGVFAREWSQEPSLDPDATLVSSAGNQLTFLLHRGSLRRKPQSNPPGIGWQDLIPTNRSVGGLCLADAGGVIWYRGSDKHLLRVAGNNFEPLPGDAGLGDNPVNCMTIDPKGNLWVATDKQIAMWTGNHFEDRTPANSGPLADTVFLSVMDDGRFWAGVGGRVREAAGGQWILEADSLKNVFSGNLSRGGALEDHHGGVWLYDYGRGLWHVAADGRVRQFGAHESFPGERVNCLFEDHEGNWWAGMDVGGLVRIRERRFQIVDMGGQLSAKPARSVCEETNGALWIGTLGDGLARWQDGTVTNLAMPGGTGKGFVFCVCPDATGRLWVSAGDEDLYVRENGVFNRVIPVVHGVKAIFADKRNRLWVGTKAGLFFADPEYEQDFREYEGVGRRDVRCLSEDGLGNIWAGTEDGSLFRISDTSIDTFHPIDGKPSQAIWSLLAEADGTVWAGTFRGGLLRFRNGQFTRFSVNEGLLDNVICQILPDASGNLWLGSHQGIFEVAKSALDRFALDRTNSIAVTEFGRSDGLPSLECSGGYQPAAWRSRDGRLWFTTVKGAVSIQPKEIRPNRLPPPIVIEEILVDGNNLDAADNGEKSASTKTPNGIRLNRDRTFLELPPGKHQIEFRYTGLSLVSPDRVQFRYRLADAESKWVDAGKRRSVTYPLLPAGTYDFRVIACNSDGIWNEKGAALKIKILPHFYETWWFDVLAAAATIAIIAFAIRNIALRRLRWKMQQLERQHAVERERSRIARDIHDDLGASLNLIAVLGDLAKKEKTDERIEKMSATARQAVTSLDEIVWAVNPRNDTLAHLVDYAGQYATGYLRATGIRCLLDVPEEMPASEVSSDVRHNLFLVIKEGLQNIVKHSRATEVWLRVRTSPDTLRVVIEDNGRGFGKNSDDPWADGLRNMRERAAEIGGQCRVESHLGTGTTIIIELPRPAR